ncbi:MAG: CHAD domain-containing protein [Chromatiaceae bacterium]|nr:CHAD domain-containing protein [Chromatiaceae bacterium]
MRQTNSGTAELLVPSGLELHALIDAIGELIPAVREPDVTLSRRFFDSFDWRLFVAGVSLEWRFSEASASPYTAMSLFEDAQPARSTLCWRDLSEPDAEPILQPLESEPGLLDEMPAGPVRERLAPLLEMRRLLPMVEVISQQTLVRLLNEDEKTVVRLVVEQNHFREPNAGRHGNLMCRLRLLSVRGYAEAFEQARLVLEKRLGLSVLDEPLAQEPLAQEPLAQEALLAAGHRPGAYSTKLDQQLEPDQRADLATKQILRGLLETLEANLKGTRQNLDSEFLHDLRVATRRTRSALSQIKGVFPEALVVDFKQRFAWLQQITGPVRDLDVYLLDFPDMERRLPPALRSDLKPLHEQLVRLHAEAQRQLTQALGSAAFDSLLRDWHRFLDAEMPVSKAPTAEAVDLHPQARQAHPSHGPLPSNAGLPRQALLPKQAAVPIKQVADQRIRKMLKRVRAEGRAITEDSPPEALHELRKSCKKLRYLMEFFQSLYPKEQIREQIKQTKLLLDNLGRFQDTAVQAQHLREHAESSVNASAGTSANAGANAGAKPSVTSASTNASKNGLPPGTLLAMGALIGQLLNDQASARANFSDVFAAFDSAENAKRFKTLFATHDLCASAESARDKCGMPE